MSFCPARKRRSLILRHSGARAGISIFSRICRRGGHVFGLCGGYQMLGKIIRDPRGIEGPPGEAQGLGLLDIETDLAGDKCWRRCTERARNNGAPFTGYEMHVGRSFGPDCARPMLHFTDGRGDGAVIGRWPRERLLCAWAFR